MVKVIGHRLLASLPVLFVVSVLTFIFVSLIPGDPALEMLGPDATPEQVAVLNEELGLDQSLLVQYGSWLSSAMTGDLGRSLHSGLPVAEVLSARIPVTIGVIVLATILSAILGVTVGTVSALRGGMLARVLDSLSQLWFAVPNFWLGLILVSVFAVLLGLLPATGYVSPEKSVGGWLEHLVLPVLTLGLWGIASVAKQTREAMLDVLGREFIDALRAQGVPTFVILTKHALRNAAVPVVTSIGILFVGLLGGTVLVEQVFVMPGLGSLAITATAQHDLPVIQGVAVTYVLIVIFVNLLVDLAYGWLNPKARVS